jgi:response regulator RpfG family c-di-GMP phosphodiesterase
MQFRLETPWACRTQNVGRVILAVEDEPLVRMFIADFLDEAGFKVIEAVNADEAITLLQHVPTCRRRSQISRCRAP